MRKGGELKEGKLGRGERGGESGAKFELISTQDLCQPSSKNQNFGQKF